MPFSGLGLSESINKALSDLGFKEPTPIQEKAIPLVLEGRDIIGSAQTGTGKTAAFGLPILQKITPGKPLQCLILEPTRELAAQVEEAITQFAKHLNISVGVVFGGVKYGGQLKMFSDGVEILVATPGRLLDHLGQGALSLKSVDFLVLDEVDRMLDMGFLPDVRRIVKQCKDKRQTLLFTATLPPAIKALTEWVLKDPEVIEIGRPRGAAETVSHAFYPVVERQKYKLLSELLERTNYTSVLIFTRTKFNADMIARRLERSNHSVAALHSDRSQSERTAALKAFKDGSVEVLVATDIAARGLDIAGVTHVINYDVPLNPEDYVHRIGRTGRASREGDAFTLLTEDEVKNAAAIEHFIGQKVERKKLEGFDYTYSALFDAQEKRFAQGPRSRLHGRSGR